MWNNEVRSYCMKLLFNVICKNGWIHLNKSYNLCYNVWNTPCPKKALKIRAQVQLHFLYLTHFVPRVFNQKSVITIILWNGEEKYWVSFILLMLVVSKVASHHLSSWYVLMILNAYTRYTDIAKVKLQWYRYRVGI